MRMLQSLACLCLLVGCSLEQGKSGDRCQRSTQCAPGLACVSGKCGKDLSSIAATNTVPMLRGSAGAAGSATGTGGHDTDATAGGGG